MTFLDRTKSKEVCRPSMLQCKFRPLFVGFSSMSEIGYQ